MRATSPLNTANAPHYVWGDACDGWHLLDSAGLSVIEERMPGGSSEVRHHHHRATQVFYVLQGTLSMECDGITHQLSRGLSLTVAAGSGHQAMNTGDEDVRFLVISAPSTKGDRHLS